MNIHIADIIILTVFTAGFIMGKRQGFIKSAVRFMVFAGSFLVSALFARMLADAIYQSFIHPQVRSAAEKQMEILSYAKTLNEITASDVISNIISSMPAFMQPFFGKITAAPGSFDHSTAETLISSVSAVFKPAIMPFLSHLSFMLLFALSATAVKITVIMAKVIKKIPGMGKIDHFLGGCLGALTATACSAFAIKAFLFLTSFPPVSDSMVTLHIRSLIGSGIISGFFARL